MNGLGFVHWFCAKGGVEPILVKPRCKFTIPSNILERARGLIYVTPAYPQGRSLGETTRRPLERRLGIRRAVRPRAGVL